MNASISTPLGTPARAAVQTEPDLATPPRPEPRLASSPAKGEAAAELEVAPGDWGQVTVTRRCCGAGCCRNLAPELFADVGARRPDGLPIVQPDGHEPGAFTGVIRQPRNAEEYRSARLAAAGCAFGAIRLRPPASGVPKPLRGSAWAAFPKRIDPEGDPTVWVLGQPSKRNFGAMGYFIERGGGGILVDCPRPSASLFEWLEAHGGVRWIFLTHIDHVQHHAEYKARFPQAQRVLGAKDVNRWQTPFTDVTTDVELKLPADQTGPMQLDGTPIPLEALPHAEFAVIPQPGHTPGSCCLLLEGRYLFTGDHMSWSAAAGHLIGHRLQCWESWERQTASVARMAEWARAGRLRFSWVLPGHGEWAELGGEPDPARTAEALECAVDWMREQPGGNVPLARWIPYSMSRTKPKSRFARFVRFVGGGLKEAWILPRKARYLLPDHPSPAPMLNRPVMLVAAMLAAALGGVALALS